MYIEKEYLFKKIDEYCELKNIHLSFNEKYQFSTLISRELDKERYLDFDSFIELLNHNEQLEQYNDLDFDDEIISIEECGYIDMIDFNVSGNKVFYANNILTHNSAVNNIDNADNSSVSDSLGTVMTADFMMFLLQNEEMKERKEIVCKITKNRFAGKTDTWMMNIDYEHMRFSDMLVQSDVNANIDITTNTQNAEQIDDFGIITSEKQKTAEEYATQEIKDIVSSDINVAKKSENAFTDNMDDLFKELGI